MALPLKPPIKPQLALSRKALPEGEGISPRTGRPVQGRVLDGVARVLAALLAIAGLGLLFDGIFDV